MLKSAMAVSCLLLLAACAAELPQPRWAAAQALGHFREAFNSGRCDSLYEEASVEFRELEARDDWLRTCDDLRARLGEWRNFDIRKADPRPRLVAHMEGTAQFAAGECRLWAAWRLEDGVARLFFLRVRGAGRDVAVPVRMPLVSPRPIDPPGQRQRTPAG
jgi:hypothetical protein